MAGGDPLEAQREATATIRGYIYQFDASILAVLDATGGDTVTVEGVEDFDVLSEDVDTHGQVKYYEAQKLTDATVRDAVLPMLEGFLRYPAEIRKRKRYVLYGHFKQAPDEAPTYTMADMQRILVHRPFKEDKTTGEKVRIELNLQSKAGASDEELADFCSRFSVRLSEPFDTHRTRVITKLAAALSVSKIEAEAYSYPSALTAMAALSTAATRPSRTTSRAAFLQLIRPDVAIYSAWALREEGENAYCRKIRELHFARLNIDSRDRFFVLSLADVDGTDELHGLVQHIIGRWSSHLMGRKPTKERYAPFFFFPGLAETGLTELKGRLVHDGYKITDGYAYQGASFSTDHLMLPQTPGYPVSARFVGNADEFEKALLAAKRARLVIQLHTGDPNVITSAVQHIAIPVNSASMARKIV
ncbi:hypothetical protein [Sphingomonas paucimobilis]|uniref:hypothetical protein n=1 Tax=Sphingomonas paucimobilis TaxID=13689 RepID=UPI0028D1B366|nr:hypothetical protein [Sphingomonas paucimobilis]